jgi:hypothetical protein
MSTKFNPSQHIRILVKKRKERKGSWEYPVFATYTTVFSKPPWTIQRKAIRFIKTNA